VYEVWKLEFQKSPYSLETVSRQTTRFRLDIFTYSGSTGGQIACMEKGMLIPSAFIHKERSEYKR
jgi:hypothetical protein